MNKKYSRRMTIRRHVLNLLNEHPCEEVRIPSYNVLSEKFGMARSTAQLELKALVDEGYLITKKGIGTFSNPLRGKTKDPFPVVSLVQGAGDYVFDLYFEWNEKMYLGKEFLKYPSVLQPLNFTSGNDKMMEEELNDLNSAALVWLNPPKSKERIIRNIALEKPLLVVQGKCEGASSLNWDLKTVGVQIGQELVRQKRTKFIYLESPNSDRACWNGVQKAFGEAGIQLKNKYLLEFQENHRNTEELLDSGFVPDAAFFRDEDGAYLVQAMKKRGIDLVRQCRLISVTYKPRNLTEPLLLAELPFDEFAKEGARHLFQRMENPDCPPADIVFKPELTIKIV